MKSIKTRSINSNRRVQMRIRLQVPVELTPEGVSAPISGLTEDISWGGVLLALSQPLAQAAESIQIALPWPHGDHLIIKAAVLRQTPLQDGRHLVAARFSSLLPPTELRLEKLLTMLRAHEAAPRQETSGQLFHELDIILNDPNELRDMLSHIASGRHTLLVFDSYALNESISLAIEGPDDLPPLRLRARVVDVKRATSGKADWAALYSLTLELEHPTDSLREWIGYFLSLLPSQETVAALYTSPDIISRGPSSARSTLSAIELNCPEILNGLIAGWGDSRAFDVVFRDLALGDIGAAAPWPTDAWEELSLLQTIHDRSYGIPEARRAPLRAGRCV